MGGLEEHIKCLREMVLFPLMYPELFDKFKTRPAKGVLFHGPPGTGKTLLARALANECSLVGGRKVAFFMRKGADCLKKWVGESERHLKLLFQQVIYYCFFYQAINITGHKHYSYQFWTDWNYTCSKYIFWYI